MLSFSSTHPARTSPVPTFPSTGWTYAGYALVLLPVLVHLIMVNRYAVNMPYLDDYTFLLDQLHLRAVPLTVGEIGKVLFQPHGEHVIFFARLTALLDAWIEGELNFRTLFYVGNFTLLGTAVLLFRLARQGGLPIWSLLPVSALLFQPQYYENTMTWAICALQHIPALFFAFLAFYLLSRPSTGAFLLSLPVAFLATFSNGNGLAVPLVGFLVIGLLPGRGRWIGWLLFTLLTGGLYVYLAQRFTPVSDSVGSNLTNPLRVVFDFFLMNGSMALLFTRSLVALSVVGLLLTLLVFGTSAALLLAYVDNPVWLARLSTRWPNPFHRWTHSLADAPVQSGPTRRVVVCLVANYGYLLITIAGIAFARGHGWHQALLVPRFIWFATVTVVIGYLLVMLWLRTEYRPRVGWLIIGLTGLFYVGSYRTQLDEVRTVRQSLTSDFYNWRATGRLVTMPPGNPAFDRYYAEVLAVAVKKGHHQPPPALFDPNQRPLTSPGTIIAKDSSYQFDRRPCRYVVLTPNALPTDADRDRGAYLLLRSGRQTTVWPIDQSRTKLAQYLMTGRSDWGDAIAIVFADMLTPAHYQVGLAYFRNDQWVTTYGSQAVRVE